MQELCDPIKRPNLQIGHWRRRGPNQRYMKYIQQNNIRKFPKSQERNTSSHTGSLYGTKQT
jgi:hypothetical protein